MLDLNRVKLNNVSKLWSGNDVEAPLVGCGCMFLCKTAVMSHHETCTCFTCTSTWWCEHAHVREKLNFHNGPPYNTVTNNYSTGAFQH